MSTIPQTNNKTIAKNTFFLYVRMLVSIVVSLYTTRVVLQTLGVEDYGIYGIVGGIISMFSFLNASMSGATSRFITFALGKNDERDVGETFSTALLIHIGISFVILLFAETVGVFFLENKLVIPEERMDAARYVYQFSVLAMVVQVTQVPYNASIIAYEKMDIYAYVELLNVFLKLGIVYLVLVGNLDKLILYAVLYFLTNFLVAVIYRLYCIRNFSACHFKLMYRKEKLYPMLSFSGWDLYGNMSYSVNHQGINMLINMFFGVVYNAASSFATSIKGVVETLSSNVIQAFRPQIVKNYAIHNIARMEMLMCNSLKFSLLLMMLFSVPIICETQELLFLWLGIVPDSTAVFCQLLLIASIFNLINKIILIGIHATGNIKRISLITGTIYLLELPVIYVLFRWFKASPSFAYIATIITMCIVVAVNAYILKKQIPLINLHHYLKGIFSGLTISLVAIVPILPFLIWMEDGVGRLIVISLIYGLSLLLAIYFWGIDGNMRIVVNNYIRKHMPRFCS